MAKTLDLTHGPIARKLLLFALPLLGASLIQQLYTTVDILFVSNYLGTEASAAVGASVLLNSALVNLFTGISIGAGVVIAQAFGRKEEVQLSKSIHTSMMLGLIGGAAYSYRRSFRICVFECGQHSGCYFPGCPGLCPGILPGADFYAGL